MANEDHIAQLMKGVNAWNKWRDENPNIHDAWNEWRRDEPRSHDRFVSDWFRAPKSDRRRGKFRPPSLTRPFAGCGRTGLAPSFLLPTALDLLETHPEALLKADARHATAYDDRSLFQCCHRYFTTHSLPSSTLPSLGRWVWVC
jgi:hypothetical protein